MDARDIGWVPRIGTLQVVFKIVERCNINCSYCYYFNMGETSALSRPVKVAQDTVRRAAAWIAEGCRDLGIPNVLISFHGGEPMMVRPQALSSMCDAFRAALVPEFGLGFSIQTNGTILSEAWLDVFARHEINIGVSIDGDRPAQDRFRRDHRDRSTFDRVEGNLRRLVDWAEAHPNCRPSTISVLDWRNDYRAIYAYLRGLGVRRMSFLLPDRSFDGFSAEDEVAGRYGRPLSEIFDAWLAEGDPAIGVRQIREFVQHFQVRRGRARPSDPDFVAYQVIVLQSDGTVSVNDSYIPALEWYSQVPSRRIDEVSLRRFLAQPVFEEIARAGRTPAGPCRSCMWLGLCRGGDLENRFSPANGFDNPSVYCQAYQTYFEHACGRLLAGGYPVETMHARLQATLDGMGNCAASSSLLPRTGAGHPIDPQPEHRTETV